MKIERMGKKSKGVMGGRGRGGERGTTSRNGKRRGGTRSSSPKNREKESFLGGKLIKTISSGV